MTKSGMIRKKGLAVVLSLGMVASIFVGHGPLARAIDETYTETQDGIAITYGFVRDGDNAEKVYIHNVIHTTTTDVNDHTVPATITIPRTITDPSDSTKTLTVNSIGSSKFDANLDSFFDSTVTIPDEVTIDASGTLLKKVEKNVGLGKRGITLKLPKTLESVGEKVLSSTSGAGNHIYVDALNASFADKSTYTGVTFHGYKNSTMKTHFGVSGFTSDGDKPSAGQNYATGSVSFILELGGTDGPVHPDRNGSISSLYAYANTNINNYTSFMNLAKVPKRNFHTFSGYYDGDTKVFDENGEYMGWNQPAEAGGGPLDTKTLTAKWSPVPEGITVSFDSNASNAYPATGTMANINVTYGVPYQDPSDQTKGLPANEFSRTGYTFTGWSTTSGGNPTYTDGTKDAVFHGNTTLYACWNEIQYRLEFNPDYPSDLPATDKGPTAAKTENKKITDKAETISGENKGFFANGYDFVGWSYKTAALTTGANPPVERPFAGATVGKVLEDNSYTTDPIKLYAVWREKKYGIHYYHTQSGNDENMYTCWEPVTIPVGRDKPGYKFVGWSKTNGGSPTYKAGERHNNIFDSSTYPNYNPLYACYEKDKYTIKYLKNTNTTGGTDDGDLMEDSVFFYDTTNTIKDCSYTRKGCKFVGWTTVAEAPLEIDEPDDNIIAKTPYNTLSGEFPKSSFYNELYSEKDSSNTVKFYPLWKKIKYRINYNDNATDARIASGTKTSECSYTQDVTLPKLTRPGHFFKGWYDEQNNKIEKITSAVIDGLTGEAVTKNYTINLHANWDDDHVIKLGNSNIKTVTAKVDGITKTLVADGTVQNITFKGKDRGDEKLSEINITAIDNYLITGYTLTDGAGATLDTGTYSTPSSSIRINKYIDFPASDLTITVTVKAAEYKIDFILDGGTIIGTTPTKYSYGTETMLPTYVVKDNSKFYGWKDSTGTIVTMISKNQTGNKTFTAIWSDPYVTGLPKGATASVTSNGVYLVIRYADGKSEDVNLAAQGIALKNGSNTIQFKVADNKTYMITVNHTTATALPSTVKAYAAPGSATATITYADGTTQSVVINKYNSENTLDGTRIYFDGIDGKRYMVIPSDGTKPDPSASPKPSSDPESGLKPQPDEYYMISKVSYNVKSGKASATNPVDWDAKSVTIKSSVKIYGKSYKVTKVKADAFYGMPKLKTLTIGKYVTSIGKNAARDCKKLTVVKILSGNVTSMGKNWLKNTGKKLTVYIKASKKKYAKMKALIKKKSGCSKSTKFKRTT